MRRRNDGSWITMCHLAIALTRFASCATSCASLSGTFCTCFVPKGGFRRSNRGAGSTVNWQHSIVTCAMSVVWRTRRGGSGSISFAGCSSSGSVMARLIRSEEHTSELQSLMRISYAVFCLKKKQGTVTELHQNTLILNNITHNYIHY